MGGAIPERMGDFEIGRELGRGGMGVVYEARQLSLNRKVALKVLSSGLGLSSRAVQRFRREAEAAAKLHHTNIVPVYATGEEAGAHFYAMELIEGPSLDQVIRQTRAQRSSPSPNSTVTGPSAEASPELVQTGPYFEATTPPPAAELTSSSFGSGTGYFDTVARMIAEVADALEYAHQQGVVHRDVKPSNLLLAPAGRLSINDFGLARMLEQPGMTMTGEFVGTPAYMSPEQIAAGRTPLDHRTDIYSLGATLYELLTLRPPFVGERRDQVLAQILHKDPRPPRRINRKVPVDLETICLKAMEKDPDRRYQRAGAMAEDLRRYVNRFAISARRAGPTQRLVKWVRRRPAVAVALGCLVVALALVIVFAYRADQADRQRLAEHEQARLQLLDEKIRNAYLIATTGDLQRTDEAIKEIEELGASTGQVRLLRGMVAYFRQDLNVAISELEQAIKLLPQSVAARALLAMVCAEIGYEDRYEDLSLEIETLSPTTAEDYLFKGYARQVNETGQGLDDVNQGIHLHDSPLGRAVRAIVRASHAIDSVNPQEAGEAAKDADVARGMLPNNQFVLYASVYARLAAANIYKQAHLPEKARAVMADAERDVEALEPYIGLSNPAWMMWQYYYDNGNAAKALEVARRSLERTQTPTVGFYCAISLYLQGQIKESWQTLDRLPRNSIISAVTWAFLVAELPDGPRRVAEESERLARKYTHEVWELRYRAHLLLFAGKKEQALALLRNWRRPYAHASEWKEFYEAMRRFGAGEISEKEYLEAAGVSRWKQCLAYTEAGLFRLADGDRVAARKHFQTAVDTYAIWEFQWTWALMFLDRLNKDPQWPPWIPARATALPRETPSFSAGYQITARARLRDQFVDKLQDR
jgi:serine/threonine protein kinase